MAEKDASLAVENAIEKLVQATRLLRTVNKFEKLRKPLIEIKKLVKESDGQEFEPEVAEWLRKVKKVAYESQNLIGTIVVDTNLQNQRSKFKRLLSGGRGRIPDHQDEIEKIAGRMEYIVESFKEPDHDGTEIDEVVGFEKLQGDLISDLINESEQQRDVILIQGKAGSGKMTLAKMVYNNKSIKECFGHREWVYIPKEHTLEEILRKMLRHGNKLINQTDNLLNENQLKAKLSDDLLNENQLKAKLSEFLKGKKYLIVLDSIHNNEAWNELLTSFPDEQNGSRVLLTSRLNQQASAINRSHEIKPLNVSQSWEILSKKVFSGDECPKNLEEIGKEMVKECKGSPRAVLALAAILHHAEQTEEMWSKILKDSDQGQPIGDLSSYGDHLCAESRTCFRNLGLFPVDIQIPANQIIRIWIAEGLLKQRGGQRAEEIGKDYIEKMIAGSYIQGMRRADRSLKTCQISCRVSRFSVSEVKDIMVVHTSTNSLPEKDPTNSHSTQKDSDKPKPAIRLVIHGDSGEDVLKSLQNCSDVHVRSIHCFVKDKNTTSTAVSSNDLSGILQCNSKRLTVLNLGFLQLDRVPKLLPELKLLTYLRLRVPTAKCLPSSIGNLQYLETLDMRDSYQIKVPHEIWRIKTLRYLYVGKFSMPDTKGMQYYKALLNLQTLSGVHSDKVLQRLMVRAKFPHVRRLRIWGLDWEVKFKFLNSLDHLCYLESLRVEGPTNLPHAHAFPSSLQKLVLLKTSLEPECIKTLENLPNLKVLKLLQNAISGEKIECSAEGFSRLEVFCMENLDLKEFAAPKGAMPCLKHLIIKDLPTLKVPDHLKKCEQRH